MYLIFLCYSTIYKVLSGKWGSNPRPAAWEAAALPTELLPHIPDHSQVLDIKSDVENVTILHFIIFTFYK